MNRTERSRAYFAVFRLEPEPDTSPRYSVSVVAERTGVQIRTLRVWESYGIIEASSAQYSEADIERARRTHRLINDLGVNVAGAAAILHLRQQLVELQREMDRLRRSLPEG
ncbi:MAG: MerR family transcriptional regulator [Chloroflexota bacterium]